MGRQLHQQHVTSHMVEYAAQAITIQAMQWAARAHLHYVRAVKPDGYQVARTVQKPLRTLPDCLLVGSTVRAAAAELGRRVKEAMTTGSD